jgi:predicted DNA-binding transcriptional regulator YafY
MPTIQFLYLNHAGKLSGRTVTVDSVEFHRNPGFGYQPGWFISGFDHDKAARRSFALSRIQLPEEEGSNKTFRLMNVKGL